MFDYIKKKLLVLLFVQFSLLGYTQNDKPLLIGDPAPVLKYSKWLKGNPVTSFDDERIYVIEFWATWCGPCVAAMPHLSELARKYDGKVTFIGMNVWENNKSTEKKLYEDNLPKLAKFVTSLGDRMSYNVAADNNEEYMSNNWLKRASVPGIPTTFLIKEGKVYWIGHPKDLDSVLVKVEGNRYDLAQYRKAHESSILMSNKAAAEERKLIEPIDAAIAAKEYGKAFVLMDEAIANNPLLKYTMNIRRFKTLLDCVGEKQALRFSEEWKKKDGERVVVYLAQAIAERKGLSKETYLYAAEIFKQFVEGSSNVNPMFCNYMAMCYGLAGDYENAIISQEKAVVLAKEAVKTGRLVGVIHDYTVTEYEKTLQKYKLANGAQ